MEERGNYISSTGSFQLFDGSLFLGICGENAYMLSVFYGSVKLWFLMVEPSALFSAASSTSMEGAGIGNDLLYKFYCCCTAFRRMLQKDQT